MSVYSEHSPSGLYKNRSNSENHHPNQEPISGQKKRQKKERTASKQPSPTCVASPPSPPLLPAASSASRSPMPASRASPHPRRLRWASRFPSSSRAWITSRRCRRWPRRSASRRSKARTQARLEHRSGRPSFRHVSPSHLFPLLPSHAHTHSHARCRLF